MSRPVVESIVTEFDVPARMRDGVALRANIFRPATGDRKSTRLNSSHRL